MSIELHIEELVLRGFAPGNRYRIAAAVQRELTRLIAERGVAGALVSRGDVERLACGTFEVTPGTRAEAVGTQIANALHGGLVRLSP